uniref:1-phosphatidylinositol 4-kinase n=1 Tax=Tetraselmis sp. GSL018 TaxID=582737 RepID=A0A061RGS5_9CHLO
MNGSHMGALLAHLHRPGAKDFAFLKALAGAVFESYVAQLQRPSLLREGMRLSPTNEVAGGRRSLLEVLIDNVSAPNGNPEVSEMAESFVMRLLTKCPALLWSRMGLRKLLMSESTSASRRLARLGEAWMASAAKIAPHAAEAVLHEELRGACNPRWRGLSGAASQLLAAASALSDGNHLRGLPALSQKIYFCGVASGFEAGELAAGSASGWSYATRMLESAASDESSEELLQESYLQAAAVLVERGDSLGRAEYFHLLRLLAWVPDKFPRPDVLRTVVFGLTWVAVGSPEVVPVLMSEVANVWVSLASKQLGLFAGGLLSARDSVPDDVRRGIDAQSILLDFLEEQWTMTSLGVTHEADATMAIFGRMLEQTLRRAASLLLHPCCAAPHFRLLTLGLRFCHISSAVRPKGDMKTHLLFSGILRAALRWFSSTPLFHQTRGPSSTRRDAEAVEAFLSSLEAFGAPPPLSATFPEEANRVHPVWGQFETQYQVNEMMRELIDLLRVLLRNEASRLKVWESPLSSTASPPSPGGGSGWYWTRLAKIAWATEPAVAMALTERFPAASQVEECLAGLVAEHCGEPAVRALPRAAVLLAHHCRSNPGKRALLAWLSSWRCADLVTAISLLNGEDAAVPEIRSYALRSLHACDPEQVAFYLPQLVQCLRNDSSGDLKDYLKAAARQSYIFCHRLVWNLQSEEKPPSEAFNPEVKRSGWEPPKDTGLWDVVGKVKTEVLHGLSPNDLDYLRREFGYFDDITKISGYLKKYDKAERPAKIGGYLSEVGIRGGDLYLPTNPDSRVVRLIPESGTPMQSAAKVPILVAFEVEPRAKDVRAEQQQGGMARFTQACIFKVGDDCRQDVMSLQVISLLKDVFHKAGLDLYLMPYGVLPTGYECGIIEVVPNSASRASLGETSESGLYEIFQREFGEPGTARFEEARLNFIRSSAGYAVASFLLQAKDRHNGNILLDTMGHLIHIDFGFVLEISPGNNMRFESAAFKLSHEMCQLLDPGGHRSSDSFRMFEELCVKGYLAARTNADAIMAAVGLMADSGLPCFGRGEPIKNLYKRFRMEQTDAQATEFMRSTITDAYDKWTTRFYDVIQWYQQGIEM